MRGLEAFSEAIDVWGEQAQIMMAIEEMAELTDLLAKYLRGRDVKLDDVASEVADVLIMMKQLSIIIQRRDYTCPPRVEWHYIEKIDRLKKRLEGAE